MPDRKPARHRRLRHRARIGRGHPPTVWHDTPGLWVKGYQHSLVVPSEVGKSILMSDLAALMALRRLPAGLSAPDDDVYDDDVRILYLDAENSQRDGVRRFGLMRYEFNGELTKRVFYRSFPDIPPLNTLEGAGRVLDFIESKRINFVGVDTFSKFIDGNENDPGPYTELARHLLNHLRKQEITSVWFDHTGHVEKRARGSSAKKDNFDTAWRMELKTRDSTTGISKLELTPDNKPKLRGDSPAWTRRLFRTTRRCLGQGNGRRAHHRRGLLAVQAR